MLSVSVNINDPKWVCVQVIWLFSGSIYFLAYLIIDVTWMSFFDAIMLISFSRQDQLIDRLPWLDSRIFLLIFSNSSHNLGFMGGPLAHLPNTREWNSSSRDELNCGIAGLFQCIYLVSIQIVIYICISSQEFVYPDMSSLQCSIRVWFISACLNFLYFESFCYICLKSALS